MGKVNYKELKRFADKLKKLNKEQAAQFNESVVKELAARLLAKVKQRTPVGDYSKTVKKKVYDYWSESGTDDKAGKRHRIDTGKTKLVKIRGNKQGGTLWRGWTVGEVIKSGDTYSIDVINPTLYASYVEHGHRTSNHEGWVEGRFMLTISTQELEAQSPALIEAKLNKFLREAMK